METRVYLYDLTKAPKINPEKCSDEDFINACEQQGGVYSLEGFQNAYNTVEPLSKLPTRALSYIRFITINQ